jgi:hypothetical protein
MTMRLIQQTQSINTSEIDLRSVSCMTAEKEYEDTLNMLCRMKEENRPKQDYDVLQRADFMFQIYVCLVSHDLLQLQHIKTR